LPGEEDFGIVTDEAQACGRPVVALGRGGALETVVDGVNGLLYSDPDVSSLATALERMAAVRFNPEDISRSAQRFSQDRHVQHMRDVIDETTAAAAGARW
jgi:glycosyltransferase involved in cell wall biosynthesis